LLAPQPLAVSQSGPGKVGDHGCLLERLDRLAVKLLGGVAALDKRARPCPRPGSPRRSARGRAFCESVSRLACSAEPAGGPTCFEQLVQSPRRGGALVRFGRLSCRV